MGRANPLRIVRQAEHPSLDDQLQLALIQHRRALEQVKSAEDELLPLRREYARRKGEFMLPTMERLNREFLA